MILNDVAAAARTEALAVLGALSCRGDAAVPNGAKTLILLGPNEPGFWSHVTRQPEFADGSPDPIDRWSRRVIDAMAKALGGQAIFPFGGPPYAPFQRWAMESGRAWPSPVGLLVHDMAGLWISYRGAIALPVDLDLPVPPVRPCDTCSDKPCLSACPVGALNGEGYDLPACHAFLDGAGRTSCMETGCQVRKSCPAGADYARLPAQSAYHMRQFHP